MTISATVNPEQREGRLDRICISKFLLSFCPIKFLCGASSREAFRALAVNHAKPIGDAFPRSNLPPADPIPISAQNELALPAEVLEHSHCQFMVILSA
jgi:hypothetical protein